MTTMARRRTTLVALTAAMLAGFFFTTGAPPADAAISSVEREVIRWINVDRVALGLRPLVLWGKLASIAEMRAERMASANVMSHTISGSLSRQLSDAGARWYGYGENIAYTSYPKGIEAARRIYRLWKRSSVHWGQITSRKFNYVGLGLAYRSSNGRTFASLVFTESPDHTGPRAAITGAERKGNDLRWTWRGWDVPLQTHMAGFRDFDVQYRIDGGTWRLARDNTTSTSLTVLDRPGGHTYGLRVRGRDKAGNVGAWSPESRLSVP
jgi:uncharacterized protein YkwD